MSYIEFMKSGNLVLPGALLFHFKDIFHSPEDFIVWQYIYLQNTKDITNIATSDIAKDLGMTVHDVNKYTTSLTNSGALSVKTISIANELEIVFDAFPAFEKLEELMNTRESLAGTMSSHQVSEEDLKKLYQVFEQEMGMLSPIMMEEIQKSVKEDQISPDLITEALRQAVRNGKVNMNYIKAILRNWKKEGITTVRQVEEQRQERRRQQSGQLEISDEFRQAMKLWSD